MPKINIFVEDNTGAEYTGGESVVFIPGPISINSGYGDTNNCVYISTSQYNRLSTILNLNGSSGPNTAKATTFNIGTLALIEACLANNLDVIYCYVADYGTETPLLDYTGDTTPGEEIINAAPKTKILLPGEKVTNRVHDGNHHRYGYDIQLDFLKDKDTYNIKLLTSGYCGIPISEGEANTPSLQDRNTKKYTPDFTNLQALINIAEYRRDCRVISGFDYYKTYNLERTADNKMINTLLAQLTDGDGLAHQISKYLDDNPIVSGEYGALFFPNLTSTISLNSITDSSYKIVTLTMPSIYAYLVDYGKCLKNGQEWLPVANSERGSVASIGTPDITVTKYNLDNNIIKDTDGTSFNGIVTLRPYGPVIWGDRTLLRLDDTVKATAYLSLGLLVCDVAKRAYQAAIRYTYESNNDVTWFNFKTRVTSLLDEMTAAGVLSNYKMKKQPSIDASGRREYNKITCKITLYPNLPVENFDIYINLENAEISTSGEEE